MKTTPTQRACSREAIELRETLSHENFKIAVNVLDAIDSLPEHETTQADEVHALTKTANPEQTAQVIDNLLENGTIRALPPETDDKGKRLLWTITLHRATIAPWITEVGDEV
jgi:uncharacterized glyoxalase superfamily protein PhnB